MTARDLFDHAVFTVISLGCLTVQLAFLWDASGLHL